MKLAKIIGVAAVAGAAYSLLTHKRENGKTLLDDITKAVKPCGKKLMKYMQYGS
ncbi:MAG: hypothetical protein WBP45_00790 [Daejeonella sp.]